jgi:hypothetical protein
MTNAAWQAIFDEYRIGQHDFETNPFYITAPQIKAATNNLEPRILCKQDTRELRPQVFKENDLFILPIRNGTYAILRGEGYVDIPPVTAEKQHYMSQLDYHLDTAHVGNSEMQYLDFAYATSLIRSVLDDDSLVLTIRGRKYTPQFSFNVGNYILEVQSVQTEIDAGYEGRNQVALVEAKNNYATNTIIRQLYYPFRQWTRYTNKTISTLFFEKRNNEYHIWHFVFDDKANYNSIRLESAGRYVIEGGSS